MHTELDFAMEKVVEEAAILCSEDADELLLAAARELLQVGHRVHQLAVVVCIHPWHLAEKVLRCHVERLIAVRVRRPDRNRADRDGGGRRRERGR